MNRRKAIVLLSALIMLLAALFELIAAKAFPCNASRVYLLVPLYFWLFYSAFLLFFAFPIGPNMIAKRFMLLKAVKIVLSLFLLLALLFAAYSQAKVVLLCFLFYYTLLLLPESIFFMYIKKHA